MELQLRRKSKKLNITFAVIVGICTIIALVLSIIMYRYQVDPKESVQWETNFAVNQSTAIIESSVHWAAGEVNYGINQTKGTVQTRYSIYYKPNSTNYVLEFSNGYASANNTYYGEWPMHYTSGFDKVAYKLIKETNKTVESQMLVDLMLL
jgi:hypothetical protein